MKTIQLITVAGFALFIATAGAQQQVSLQEVRTAAVPLLLLALFGRRLQVGTGKPQKKTKVNNP